MVYINPGKQCRMECDAFSDPEFGDVSVSHDPSSGNTVIEFERLESEDTIMPQYRVSVTTEHIAGWIESVLTNECKRRCKRGTTEKRKLDTMLRVTAKDSDLVYCMHSGSNVIVIRNGCVLKIKLSLHSPMNEFYAQLIREPRCTNTTSVSRAFVTFVRGLME